MCALCGMLGGDAHWSDSAAAPAAFARRRETHTLARERQARVRLLNAVLRHYGLGVADWAGGGYLLSSRTGRTELVGDLGRLWSAAERMSGKTLDPLDERLLAALDRS
jgi:hypothetical protein